MKGECCVESGQASSSTLCYLTIKDLTRFNSWVRRVVIFKALCGGGANQAAIAPATQNKNDKNTPV